MFGLSKYNFYLLTDKTIKYEKFFIDSYIDKFFVQINT